MFTVSTPGFLSFSGTSLVLGVRIGFEGREFVLASALIVVYKVLSIYRFLPGFREIAVFEKSNRFSILFLDGRYRKGVRALARAQI